MGFFVFGPRLGLFRSSYSFSDTRGRRDVQYAARGGGAFVYVIEGEHGRVKIGVSSTPPNRLATLQTGSPYRLHLAYATWAGEHAYLVEQEAHFRLDAFRVGGEWFATSREVAVAAINVAAAGLSVPLDELPPSPPEPISWGLVLWFVLAVWIALGTGLKLFGAG